jgi:hypothetical protein
MPKDTTMPTFIKQTEEGDNCMISITPNPTNNNINIYYKIKSGKNFELCIYTLDAKMVLSKSLHDKEGNTTFNVSNLNSCHYIVVLPADGVRIANKTFVKQ